MNSEPNHFCLRGGKRILLGCLICLGLVLAIPSPILCLSKPARMPITFWTGSPWIGRSLKKSPNLLCILVLTEESPPFHRPLEVPKATSGHFTIRGVAADDLTYHVVRWEFNDDTLTLSVDLREDGRTIYTSPDGVNYTERMRLNLSFERIHGGPFANLECARGFLQDVVQGNTTDFIMYREVDLEAFVSAVQGMKSKMDH